MKKIALDAGHGLNTAGKRTPDGIKEWTLNDKVRDKVAAILSNYDCEIIHTDNNEGATDEPLATRLDTYIKAKVDAFVSIHHNAYTGTWNKATGVEVYVDKNATDADIKLAKLIYNRMIDYVDLAGRGVKRADFKVIKQDKIPAVLCEGGFMDGSYDYKIITSAAGQDAYAKAVAEGLIEFLGLKKKQVAAEPSVMYRVQVGAYRNKQYADAAFTKVKNAGFDAFMVKVDGLYKIQVGAYSKKANATSMANKIKKAGFDACITTKSGTAVEASPLKSIDEIAKEVMDGKWGNGSDRKTRLAKAGYDYSVIQKRVNELCSK